jgi:hypothetical protein
MLLGSIAFWGVFVRVGGGEIAGSPNCIIVAQISCSTDHTNCAGNNRNKPKTKFDKTRVELVKLLLVICQSPEFKEPGEDGHPELLLFDMFPSQWRSISIWIY